jgi:hypothetical protein
MRQGCLFGIPEFTPSQATFDAINSNNYTVMTLDEFIAWMDSLR